MKIAWDKALSFCALVLTMLCVVVALAQTRDANKSAAGGTSIMSFEEYAKKRHRVPYVLNVRAGKGRLLYFGANHTYDPNDPEIRQIEKEWKKFKPEIAFFEGADPETTPAMVMSREEIRGSGEPSLVLFLASRDSVPVKSLEPAQKDEIALLLKKYTPEQVKVFYTLRQIPEFRRGQHNETIETYAKGVLAWLSSKPELRGKPRTVDELQVISTALLTQLADWRDVPQEWFDPASTQGLTYLNDVSRQLSEFRDRHMLTLLTEQVAQGRRVFALVGASHVVMQERAVRAAIKAKRMK